MSVVCASLQLISSLIIGWFEYRRGSISVFLWSTLIVMFGLPHFISVMLGVYDCESEGMTHASIVAWAYNFIYIAGRVVIIGLYGDKTMLLERPEMAQASSFDNPFLEKSSRVGFAHVWRSSVYASRAAFGGILNTSWGACYWYAFMLQSESLACCLEAMAHELRSVIRADNHGSIASLSSSALAGPLNACSGFLGPVRVKPCETPTYKVY
jgi:hypothetical protein